MLHIHEIKTSFCCVFKLLLKLPTVEFGGEMEGKEEMRLLLLAAMRRIQRSEEKLSSTIAKRSEAVEGGERRKAFVHRKIISFQLNSFIVCAKNFFSS
jgi:hypothetical protein